MHLFVITNNNYFYHHNELMYFLFYCIFSYNAIKDFVSLRFHRQLEQMLAEKRQKNCKRL